MFHVSFKRFLTLIAMLATLAWAGSTSADIVTSFAGPKDFNGTSDKQVLDNVSIGQEGTVSLEFNADNTVGSQNLWYCADSPGGTNGEYRIILQDNSLKYQLWPDNNVTISAFTDTGNWHSLALTWKQGFDTQVTLDGVTTSAANGVSLPAFTSTTGNHVLGVNTANGGIRYFDGEMRNVVVTNTYSPTPEPGTFVLVVTGLLSMLAYAWRKRR